MKKKLLSILLLLIPCIGFSQEGTQDSITISVEMGRAVVRDLVDLDYLKVENSLQKSEITKLDERLSIGAEKERNLNLRLELTQKQAENYNRLYEAEKKKKHSVWDRVRDVLIGIGVGAVLFVVAK